MSAVTISFLGLDDIPNIWPIAQDLKETPWSIQGLRDMVALPTTHLFGAIKDQEIVGFLMVSFLLDESEILTFGVKKGHQNQGIGTLLLQNYIELMKNEWYCRTCHLEVRRSNHAAIHLYQKMGFIIRGIRPNYYEITDPEKGHYQEDAFSMQLKIH